MCPASSRRCSSGFSPATLISPPLGTRIPVSILIVVLLPAPFGPTRPIISPRSTESERSCTASTLRTSGSTTLRMAPSKPGLLRATRNVLLRPLALIISMFYPPSLPYSFEGGPRCLLCCYKSTSATCDTNETSETSETSETKSKQLAASALIATNAKLPDDS